MAGCHEHSQPESEYTPMIAAGLHHTLGLKTDDAVFAMGYNDFHQCDVSCWDLN